MDPTDNNQDDPIHWRIYTALGGDELKVWAQLQILMIIWKDPLNRNT